MQHHAADQLDVEVAHPHVAPARLADDREALREQVVERLAAARAAAQLVHALAQLLVAIELELGLECVDHGDPLLVAAELLRLADVQRALEKSHISRVSAAPRELSGRAAGSAPAPSVSVSISIPSVESLSRATSRSTLRGDRVHARPGGARRRPARRRRAPARRRRGPSPMPGGRLPAARLTTRPFATTCRRRPPTLVFADVRQRLARLSARELAQVRERDLDVEVARVREHGAVAHQLEVLPAQDVGSAGHRDEDLTERARPRARSSPRIPPFAPPARGPGRPRRRSPRRPRPSRCWATPRPAEP